MRLNQIYFFLVVALTFAYSTNLFAVKAYPYPVEIQQPNGEKITIQLHGDESFHYITTLDGYVIAQNQEGYYTYADISKEGHIVPGNQTVSAVGLKSDGSNLLRSDAPAFSQVVKGKIDRMNEKRTNELNMLKSSQKSAIGTRKGLVILANFADVKFVTANPNNAFTQMLNQAGYSENGGTGSARDFYMDNSTNKFLPEFDVFGPVDLPQNMAFYGENDANGDDINPVQMVIDACRAANNNYQDLNFANYDYDKNGVLDNVFIFYAGHNEAEFAPANTVWPHKYSVAYSTNLVLDGVRIADYACTSELRGATGGSMCGIGTFVHEYGHVLGLPDVYDADGAGNGKGPGLGSWSTMDNGNYLNRGRTPPNLTAVERELLGWLDYKELKPSNAEVVYTLNPITSNQAFRLNSPTTNEYFVLETRKKGDGWDKYIPGEGMMVYHIDKTINANKYITYGNYTGYISAKELWDAMIPNIIGEHQCYELLRAGSSDALAPFPSGDKNSITDYTTPNLKTWSGQQTKAEIKNIHRESSTGVVSFTCSPPTELLYPDITTYGVTKVAQNSAQLNAALLAIGTSEAAIEKGFCWNTSGTPTIESEKVAVAGITLGGYSHTVTTFGKGQEYFVRAYAKTATNVYYGKEVSFVTLPDAYRIPFAENFFTGEQGYWTVWDNNSDGKRWDFYAADEFENQDFGVALLSEQPNSNDWLVTPPINIPSNYRDVTLKFSMVAFTNERLVLKISDTYRQEDAFQQITYVDVTDDMIGWLIDLSLPINNYIGKQIFIAFVNESTQVRQMWLTKFSVDGTELTGIETIETDNDVAVYSQNSTLFVEAATPIHSVAIYDLSGRLLRNETVNQEKIQITGLPNNQPVVVSVMLNDKVVKRKVLIK